MDWEAPIEPHTKDEVFADDLSWAIAQWHRQVFHRPLQNIHRRTLDDMWRQVIRRLGGDSDNLIGPDHDTLVAG